MCVTRRKPAVAVQSRRGHGRDWRGHECNGGGAEAQGPQETLSLSVKAKSTLFVRGVENCFLVFFLLHEQLKVKRYYVVISGSGSTEIDSVLSYFRSSSS